MSYKLIHKNNLNNSSPHAATSLSRRRAQHPKIELETHGGFTTLIVISAKDQIYSINRDQIYSINRFG